MYTETFLIDLINWFLGAEHDTFFTVDGSTPDPINRYASGGRQVTHKFKAPISLKPGRRTIKAINVDK